MASKDLPNVLQEAVAGYIWLHLSLPRDASRGEIEGYAADLINRIRSGATLDVLMAETRRLQVHRLGQISSASAIRRLVERSTAIVHGAFPAQAVSLAS